MSRRAKTIRQSAPPARQTATRFDRLDALRGMALLWMAAFHFCFDLNHYGLLQADFYDDLLWTVQRTCILSLFLICAGAGQAVAVHQGQTWPRFWRRWAQVVGCAVLVSAGSYLMFPDSYIYFGVLHGMAVMLVVARLTARWGFWLWPLGLLALLLPQVAQHPMFDAVAWHPLGLVTHKPITEDYVPVLPWMGVMWWSLAATQWVLHRWPGALQSVSQQMPRWWRALAWLGGWSLTFYMLHQPVLIGGLQLWQML